MKNFKRILPLFLALMIAASAILLASCASDKKDDATASAAPASETAAGTAAETAAGTASQSASETAVTYAYTINFVCVDAEGKETAKEIKTNEKFLRGALEQEGLIKGTESEYGLMVNEVCGIVADYAADGAYWALYIGDEYAQTGVDATELVSGTTYKFVYEVYVPEYAYTINFVCVDAEGKETAKEIKTNEKFLRGALEQEGLIKGTETEYGLMVNEVCGIVADYAADGAYWALYIGDEYAQTGVDTTELVSGTTYKFVYEVFAAIDG